MCNVLTAELHSFEYIICIYFQHKSHTLNIKWQIVSTQYQQALYLYTILKYILFHETVCAHVYLQIYTIAFEFMKSIHVAHTTQIFNFIEIHIK